MFIELEIILTIFVTLILVRFLVVPAIKPLLRKKWEDSQLEKAEEKHKRAQKLLKAAELEAKAWEVELRADEVMENVFSEKTKEKK